MQCSVNMSCPTKRLGCQGPESEGEWTPRLGPASARLSAVPSQGPDPGPKETLLSIQLH